MTRLKLSLVRGFAVAGFLAAANVAEAGGKKRGKHFHGGHGYGWNYHYDYRPVHNCRYFLRKAKVTGSPYWFNKYRNCIHYW